MNVIGITGSIGMGKSTAAALLRRMNIPVHDADATVHRLLGPKGAALPVIEAAFPGVVGTDGVNRAELGRRVFADSKKLRMLEAILHPLVRQEECRFLQRHRRYGTRLVALDVPLLFETKGQKRCDRVAVLWCPFFLQKQRVLRRPGMSEQRLMSILQQQMPIQQKLKLADYKIPSGQGLAATYAALKKMVRENRPLE